MTHSRLDHKHETSSLWQSRWEVNLHKFDNEHLFIRSELDIRSKDKSTDIKKISICSYIDSKLRVFIQFNSESSISHFLKSYPPAIKLDDLSRIARRGNNFYWDYESLFLYTDPQNTHDWNEFWKSVHTIYKLDIPMLEHIGELMHQNSKITTEDKLKIDSLKKLGSVGGFGSAYTKFSKLYFPFTVPLLEFFPDTKIALNNAYKEAVNELTKIIKNTTISEAEPMLKVINDKKNEYDFIKPYADMRKKVDNAAPLLEVTSDRLIVVMHYLQYHSKIKDLTTFLEEVFAPLQLPIKNEHIFIPSYSLFSSSNDSKVNKQVEPTTTEAEMLLTKIKKVLDSELFREEKIEFNKIFKLPPLLIFVTDRREIYEFYNKHQALIEGIISQPSLTKK